MPDRYPRRSEALVVVKGTQVASRVCDGGLLAGIYHFPVQRNTMYLQVWSGKTDTDMSVTYRLLYRLGAAYREIKAVSALRTGAYDPSLHGILAYSIPVTAGANEVEVSIVSGSDVSGYVEGLWIDAQGPLGTEYMAINDVSRSQALAVGVTEEVALYAPAGYVGELKALKFAVEAPTGATAGNHSMSVLQYIAGLANGYAYGQSPFGSRINFDYGAFVATTVSTMYPPSASDLAWNIRSIMFDSVIPLRVQYFNNTDVSQSGERAYRMVVLYRRVI